MASHRKNQQESARLRVMWLLSNDPEMSAQQVADIVRIFNGSSYYVLKAPNEKRYAKFETFSSNPGKKQCAYFADARRYLRKGNFISKVCFAQT